jgi:hypothetical protein
MPATGSSNSTSFGRCTSNIPISSHCFCPWLSTPAGRYAWLCRLIRSRVATTPSLRPRRRRSIRRSGKRYVSARSRFSTTVRESNTVGVWKLRPMPSRTRFAADTPAIDWPSNVI